jgi:ribose 5-phosphate isomerase A
VSLPDPQEQAKRQAATEAVRLIPDGAIVGLGTGSTAYYAIVELGRRVREEGASFTGVPTSYSAEALARRNNIPLTSLRNVSKVDVAVDGADEIDPNLDLIKGYGGALTLEKMVDSYADCFVVIADESKLVDRLGHSASVPLEVLPSAMYTVEKGIGRLGGAPRLRVGPGGPGKAAPIITEHENLLVDVRFEGIEDPREMERSLNAIPGVVENGVFPRMAHIVLIGSSDGGEVRRLTR